MTLVDLRMLLNNQEAFSDTWGICSLHLSVVMRMRLMVKNDYGKDDDGDDKAPFNPKKSLVHRAIYSILTF